MYANEQLYRPAPILSTTLPEVFWPRVPPQRIPRGKDLAVPGVVRAIMDDGTCPQFHGVIA